MNISVQHSFIQRKMSVETYRHFSTDFFHQNLLKKRMMLVDMDDVSLSAKKQILGHFLWVQVC